MQNKKETNKLYTEDKGKWEVGISATVFADVRFRVYASSFAKNERKVLKYLLHDTFSPLTLSPPKDKNTHKVTAL